MSASLKIINPGMLSSLQDKGRFGLGSFGVPRSGAADPVALRIGNHLVGNDPFETALEFRFLGPKFKVTSGSIRVGLAAFCTGSILRAKNQEQVNVAPWQSALLEEGDVFTVNAFQQGITGYITIEGGFDLTPVLGSSSTYARAKLGGIDGQLLQAGHIISARENHTTKTADQIIAKPPPLSQAPLRVMLGPQDDYFSPQEINTFTEANFIVSSDLDRMGIRLEGHKVRTLPEKGNDLISEGLIPGVIQIPGTGDPIILSVDCQSVGGYPKIATIIRADLHRIGQLKPTEEISFQIVDALQAKEALHLAEETILNSMNSRQNYAGDVALNLDALYESNLISGIIDAETKDAPHD